MRDSNFLKWLAGIVLFTILFICGLKAFEYVGSAKRFAKGVESNWGGGLKRIVTLYDNHGNTLKQWYGKIDISDSEHEIDFIIDGRRVIVHGGIVVVEEEK